MRVLKFSKVFLYRNLFLKRKKMISLSSRDFELISCPCPKKGQNSAYHRLHVDPSSQSREPWETASKTLITSIGRRPLSYINLSITVITLLQAPKPNAICLGIFDSPATVTDLFFSPLAYPIDFILNLAKRETHNTKDIISYRWIISPLPRRILT
jgi:hypothetical protein